MNREQKLQVVATVIEQVIIRGGPELNPMQIANSAIIAWERANESDSYSSMGNVCDTGSVRGAGQALHKQTEEPHLPANPVLSHSDICLLSRCFNEVASLRMPEEVRINEWLKQQIAERV